MGAAASTLPSASDDHMINYEQQQRHPKLLTVSLDSTTTSPARLGRRRPSASTDGDEGPPQLIESPGSDSSSVCDSSEEVRKSVMLPTASAQHVGRLRIVRAGSDGAGCVVWAVPKSALLAPSPSDPKTPPATPPADGTPLPVAGTAPTLLLSPTFIVPCGVQVGPHSKDSVAGCSASATTEWQLMLEPMSPTAAGATTPATDPSALISPPIPASSDLSTPTHYDITAGAKKPHLGFTNSPEPPAAQDQGHDSDSSNSRVDSRVQVWRPSIRFVWSPSCSASSTSVAAGSSSATGLVQAAALGHQVSPVSYGISDVSSIATTSISSCSGSISDPADIQMQETAVGSSGVGNSSSSKRQVPESVIKGGDCMPKSERKLLPSSWSIRKKNLAPASYRAAYQAQYEKDESSSSIAAAELAPQAGSTRVALPLAGRHSNGSSGSSSASGWKVECAGELRVEFGGKDDAGQTAATGFDLQVNQLGGAWGAPFSLCCKQTISSAAATDPSPSTSLQLSVLPCTATGSTNVAHSSSGLLADAEMDEAHFQVDFKQVQLLLANTSAAANTAAHTAVGHSIGSDSGDRVSFEADTAAADKVASQDSNSSSKAHQQHPLGLSPPHTPTKQPSDSQQGIKGVTSNGSSGQPGNGSVADQEGVVAPSKPLPARQLEAVLLSHSPRMLVIDNFFSPELCTGLMELARDRLVRSRVASGSETPSRTSWGHFFVKDSARHPLILEAEAQIEALFNSAAVRGGYGPLAKVEAIQVVRYHPGEFYHEHYDNRADGPLARAATILVYLCDTEEGGATSFSRAVTGFGKNPAADAQVLPPKVTIGAGGRGVRVFPVQGRALVFWSKRPNGDEDPNSIHAAETVLDGEKWIATRWMKDNF